MPSTATKGNVTPIKPDEMEESEQEIDIDLDQRSDPSEALFPSEVYRTRALHLPDKTEFSLWARAGQGLLRMDANGRFWIGDWWNYGEQAYGDDAYRAVKALGSQPATVIEYSRIARRIPEYHGKIHLRRFDLDWTHYKWVADANVADDEAKSLAARDSILQLALDGGWKTRDTYDYVQEFNESHKPDGADAAPDDPPSKASATFSITFTVPKGYFGKAEAYWKQLQDEVDGEARGWGVEDPKVSASRS